MGYKDAFFLLPKSIQEVVRLIVAKTDPHQVVLFGSRARGDHRPASDFDLAIKAATLDTARWAQTIVSIEETPITLHSLDLLHFDRLDAEYKKNIESEGKVLYDSPLVLR